MVNVMRRLYTEAGWVLGAMVAAVLVAPGCGGGGGSDDDDSAPEASTSLSLNELMASNDAVLADESGEFDDWFELYNSGEQELDLGGWSLSGGPRSDEEPWVVPSGVSVPALGFLVIWADDDPEQGDLHTDFKLSKSGETLILYQPSGEQADRVEFPEQETDRSWGRVPDGSGDWQQLSDPSPAQVN